jgi:hypothetical protein
MSLALDGARKELVVGYLHQLTLRRSVLNVLEARHVKGIWNYVDFGFELRRSLLAPYASHLTVGASWQVRFAWC